MPYTSLVFPLDKLDKVLFEVRKQLNDLTIKTGYKNFEELEQFTSEDKSNFLEGHEELSDLLLNIDNQEIENLIQENTSVNNSK